MESRLAQIQAAIRRGEERASREPDSEEAPRQMTPEEEQLLEKLFVRPEDLEEAYDASPEDPPAPAGQEQEDPHTVRIRKTIEFCPDGALAWEILQEIVESGERPSVEAYDIVIEAFARHGATDDALAVFKAVKEAGLEPTDQSYDWLATPASRSGEYRFVEMLFAAKASTKADGQIGSRALKLLLDAYANGLPRQASKAQSAFRGAMAAAEAANQKPSDAASGEVLKALRRAVGPTLFRELQAEYGLELDEIA